MRNLVTAIGVAALVLWAGTASATTYGTVKAQLIDWPGESVNFYYYDSTTQFTNGHLKFSGSGVAGVYKFDLIDYSKNPGDKGKDLTDPFKAVCVDIFQTISSSQQPTWTIKDLKDVPVTGLTYYTGPMGPTRADDLKELFALVNPNDLTTKAQKAALAVLTWEIVFEDPWTSGVNPWGLAGGRLHVTGLTQDAKDWFTTWRSWLVIPTASTTLANAYGLANDCTQDFGVILPGPGGNGVPEPLTLLGVSSAVAGIAGYIRRRRLA